MKNLFFLVTLLSSSNVIFSMNMDAVDKDKTKETIKKESIALQQEIYKMGFESLKRKISLAEEAIIYARKEGEPLLADRESLLKGIAEVSELEASLELLEAQYAEKYDLLELLEKEN